PRAHPAGPARAEPGRPAGGGPGAARAAPRSSRAPAAAGRQPGARPVARLIGAVDAIVPHRDLSPPRVRAPDVAADLHGVLPDSVRALRATRPRRLIAFACPEAGHPNGPDPR